MVVYNIFQDTLQCFFVNSLNKRHLYGAYDWKSMFLLWLSIYKWVIDYEIWHDFYILVDILISFNVVKFILTPAAFSFFQDIVSPRFKFYFLPFQTTLWFKQQRHLATHTLECYFTSVKRCRLAQVNMKEVPRY